MNWSKIFLCILLFIVITTTKAQDTVPKYQHNLMIHPVLEGINFGYEKVLAHSKNHSFKASLVFKENTDNSFIYPLLNYKEQKFNIQYRRYFSNKSPNLNGFYQAANLQVKRIKGKLNLEVSRFKNLPSEYNNKAVSLGYAFGYQYMSDSGFNFDFGYVVGYQFLDGQSFQASIFEELPYRPYLNGINSQIKIVFGIAF